MNKPLFASVQCAVLLLLTLLLAGCETAEKVSLTHRLWAADDLNRFGEPAPEPRLELFQWARANDILVVYDEAMDGRSQVQRRAYLLNVNQESIKAGRKPRFSASAATNGLVGIPVTSAGLPVPAGGLYAVVSTNGQQFTVHFPGGSPLGCELPVYWVSSGTLFRAVLTPLAVAGDVVMVGVVAGIVYVAGGGTVR